MPLPESEVQVHDSPRLYTRWQAEDALRLALARVLASEPIGQEVFSQFQHFLGRELDGPSSAGRGMPELPRTYTAKQINSMLYDIYAGPLRWSRDAMWMRGEMEKILSELEFTPTPTH